MNARSWIINGVDLLGERQPLTENQQPFSSLLPFLRFFPYPPFMYWDDVSSFWVFLFPLMWISSKKNGTSTEETVVSYEGSKYQPSPHLCLQQTTLKITLHYMQKFALSRGCAGEASSLEISICNSLPFRMTDGHSPPSLHSKRELADIYSDENKWPNMAVFV